MRQGEKEERDTERDAKEKKKPPYLGVFVGPGQNARKAEARVVHCPIKGGHTPFTHCLRLSVSTLHFSAALLDYLLYLVPLSTWQGTCSFDEAGG